jgi:hypothetical protein
MPFKSKAQMRKCFALQGKGKGGKWDCKKWAHETPSVEKLPEKVEESNEDDPIIYHQTKIAKDTLRMTDAGADVMGGMSKEEARNFLRKRGYPEKYIKKLESIDEQKVKESISYPVSIAKLEDFIDRINKESNTNYSLGQVGSSYELWKNGNERVEVGSKKDLYDYLIKHRFQTNEEVLDAPSGYTIELKEWVRGIIKECLEEHLIENDLEVPEKYMQFFKGFDENSEYFNGIDHEIGHYIFEFPDEHMMQEFLKDIHGDIFPEGSKRVIVMSDKTAII